jgi:RNA polymerase sigma-70 factor, ECF subfamily
MEVTDAAVVAQVLAGDRDAFRVLVDRHSRSIFRVIYRMTVNQQDTEELVQETFLRAYKSLERFELRANFSTWLYRIAVNRTLDFLSARKTHMQTKDTYQIVDNPEAGDSSERVAFTMRHMEGRSIEEISQTLNLKASAAKNSVFRAVQKLRQQLEPYASPGSSRAPRGGVGAQ